MHRDGADELIESSFQLMVSSCAVMVSSCHLGPSTSIARWPELPKRTFILYSSFAAACPVRGNLQNILFPLVVPAAVATHARPHHIHDFMIDSTGASPELFVTTVLFIAFAAMHCCAVFQFTSSPQERRLPELVAKLHG